MYLYIIYMDSNLVKYMCVWTNIFSHFQKQVASSYPTEQWALGKKWSREEILRRDFVETDTE